MVQDSPKYLRRLVKAMIAKSTDDSFNWLDADEDRKNWWFDRMAEAVTRPLRWHDETDNTLDDKDDPDAAVDWSYYDDPEDHGVDYALGYVYRVKRTWRWFVMTGDGEDKHGKAKMKRGAQNHVAHAIKIEMKKFLHGLPPCEGER